MLQVLWCESNVLVLSYHFFEGFGCTDRLLLRSTDWKVYCINIILDQRHCDARSSAIGSSTAYSCQPNAMASLRQESVQHFMLIRKMRKCVTARQESLRRRHKNSTTSSAQTRAKRQHMTCRVARGLRGCRDWPDKRNPDGQVGRCEAVALCLKFHWSKFVSCLCGVCGSLLLPEDDGIPDVAMRH